MKAMIVVVDDTSKADDELGDSDGNVTLCSTSGNSKPDETILSLFLSDTEKSDLSVFVA